MQLKVFFRINWSNSLHCLRTPLPSLSRVSIKTTCFPLFLPFLLTLNPLSPPQNIFNHCSCNLKPDIKYLSVGGEHLKALGIESLYDLKEITYLGFTKVLLNVFKIKKKINETVNKIIEFNPDILFSVDSPDFTLRVAKKIKKL